MKPRKLISLLLLVVLLLPNRPIQVVSASTENLSTWTESDSLGKLSTTSDRVTFTNLERDDPSTYLYDTKTGELADFELTFQMKITHIDSSTKTVRMMPLNIGQKVGQGFRQNWLDGDTQIGLQIRSWSSTSTYTILLVETYSGLAYSAGAQTGNLNVNTLYYVYMKKDGTSLTYKVDDNSDFSSPIQNAGLTLHADHDLNYIMFPQSVYSYAGTERISGYQEYLDMGGEDAFSPVPTNLSIGHNATEKNQPCLMHSQWNQTASRVPISRLLTSASLVSLTGLTAPRLYLLTGLR